MNRHLLSSLERERDFLLAEWARADEEEKVRILVKIMDIDETLEANNDDVKAKKFVL